MAAIRSLSPVRIRMVSACAATRHPTANAYPTSSRRVRISASSDPVSTIRGPRATVQIAQRTISLPYAENASPAQ